MKAEIKISPEVTEPYAVIYASEVTAEINRIVSIIEGNMDSSVITVADNGRVFVLHPEDVYMIRVEEEKTVVYTKANKYSGNKRLYEFEALLDKDFMRISKSALVNLKYLDYVEPSFSGVMVLTLKNGCKDYISRKYLPAFKKYLGI